MSSWSFRRTPFLIAGPCVVEDGDTMARVAEAVAEAGERFGIRRVCFKASFDKANRARVSGARAAREWTRGSRHWRASKRETSGLPLLTDIHEPAQAAPSAEVADVLQIPAFLCRQTDLLLAAGATGKPVNVKKGQWMHADGMAGALEKVRAGGSSDVAVTERGTFFGYGDLVVDFRNFVRLREATGAPVIFDATHSVQQPGQAARRRERRTAPAHSRPHGRGGGGRRRRLLPRDPSRPRARALGCRDAVAPRSLWPGCSSAPSICGTARESRPMSAG